MKKFYLAVIVILTLAFCSRVFAEVVTTTRKINKPAEAQQTQTKTPVQTKRTTQNKLVNNVKSCIPYTESTTFDVSGMNFIFNIKIAGWVNNKCRLDFTSDTSGVASSFQSIYGIDPSQAEITAFAPKFRCEFTKQQLEEVGDSILQEEERKAGAKNNMLKDPNSIDILSANQLSSNDMKLFSMLTDGRTCRMVNTGDVNRIINSIFGF